MNIFMKLEIEKRYMSNHIKNINQSLIIREKRLKI